MVRPVYKTIDGKLIIYDRVPDDFDESLLEGESLAASKEKAHVDEAAMRSVDAINNDLFFMLKFRNLPTLRRWQAHAQEALSDQNIEWEDLGNFHITLVFVSGVSRMDTFELTMGVDVINVVSVVIEGFGTFSTERGDSSNTLYLAVEKTEELVEIQERLFDFVKGLGFETSPFSIPQDWTPHITLGTSEEPFDEMLFPDVGGMAISASDVEASVDFEALAISEKFNPYHLPAGTSEGGQFTTAEGAGGLTQEGVTEKERETFLSGDRRDDLADEIDDNPGELEQIYDGNINSAFKFTTFEGEEVFVKAINFQSVFEGDRRATTEEVEEFELELLSTKLAEQMGTDSAVLDVWDVSPFSSDEKMIATEWVDGESFGNAFSNETSDAINHLSDKEFTDVLVTEIVLGNSDRHSGNVMLSNNGKVILIDNGRAFSLQGTEGSSFKREVFDAFENNDVDLREMDLDTLNWFSEAVNTEGLIRTAKTSTDVLSDGQIDAFRGRLAGLSKIAQIAENRGDMTSIEFFELVESKDFRDFTFDSEVILGGDRTQ